MLIRLCGCSGWSAPFVVRIWYNEAFSWCCSSFVSIPINVINHVNPLLNPLQNVVLVGYTVFSMSVIPWFHQHLRCLLYNFDSFCPILFKFTPHHNHQTVHVWKENRGWRLSITRIMPLCNSYNKDVCIMTDSAHFVKSSPPRAFIRSFQHLKMCYRHIEDVHKEVWCWKNTFWQIDRVFNLVIFWQLHLVNNRW